MFGREEELDDDAAVDDGVPDGSVVGPDRAGNMLEIVSVTRDEADELVIHPMRMRAKYEPFLRGEGDSQ